MKAIKRVFLIALAAALLAACAACVGEPGRYTVAGYDTLLDYLSRFVETARQGGDFDWILEPDKEYLASQEWITDYTSEGNIGYAAADINSDGTPELLWLGKSREAPEDFVLIALFTLKGNKPVRLASYGLRGKAALGSDGTLYCVAVWGMGTALYSFKLKPGAGELTQMDTYYKEASGTDGTVSYFRGDSYDREGQSAITGEEFAALLEQYRNPSNPMKLDFIPVE